MGEYFQLDPTHPFTQRMKSEFEQLQRLYNLYLEGGREPLDPSLRPRDVSMFVDVWDSEGRLLPPLSSLFASSEWRNPCQEIPIPERPDPASKS